MGTDAAIAKNLRLNIINKEGQSFKLKKWRRERTKASISKRCL